MKRPKIGVSGILRNGDGKILLGRRDPNDSAGGKWVTPGGGVEYGEDVNAACAREFKEETGLSVWIPLHREGFTTVKEVIDGKGHVIMVFKEAMADDVTLATSPVAGDGLVEVAWFDEEAVERMWRGDQITKMTYQAVKEYYEQPSR